MHICCLFLLIYIFPADIYLSPPILLRPPAVALGGAPGPSFNPRRRQPDPPPSDGPRRPCTGPRRRLTRSPTGQPTNTTYTDDPFRQLVSLLMHRSRLRPFPPPRRHYRPAQRHLQVRRHANWRHSPPTPAERPSPGRFVGITTRPAGRLARTVPRVKGARSTCRAAMPDEPQRIPVMLLQSPCLDSAPPPPASLLGPSALRARPASVAVRPALGPSGPIPPHYIPPDLIWGGAIHAVVQVYKKL